MWALNKMAFGLGKLNKPYGALAYAPPSPFFEFHQFDFFLVFGNISPNLWGLSFGANHKSVNDKPKRKRKFYKWFPVSEIKCRMLNYFFCIITIMIKFKDSREKKNCNHEIRYRQIVQMNNRWNVFFLVKWTILLMITAPNVIIVLVNVHEYMNVCTVYTVHLHRLLLPAVNLKSYVWKRDWLRDWDFDIRRYIALLL